MSVSALNMTEAIDSRRLSRFQIELFVLGALIAAIDGYDNQSIGYTGTSLMASLGLQKAQLGPIFSAGIFGAALGAVGFSPFADRFGRRRLLIAAITTFTLFTLAVPFTQSISQLVIFRFLAGTGLGCTIPTLIALCIEYAPRRFRATVVTLIFSTIPVGGLLGGVTASYLIPHLGWRSVFYLGAAIPFLLGVIAFVWLPESLCYLTGRGNRPEEAKDFLSV